MWPPAGVYLAALSSKLWNTSPSRARSPRTHSGGRPRHGQPLLPLLDQGLDHLHRQLDRFVHRGQLVSQGELVAHEAGDLQQVLDQPGEVPDLARPAPGWPAGPAGGSSLSSRRWVQTWMGASGLRISCASWARNSSLRRSASESCSRPRPPARWRGRGPAARSGAGAGPRPARRALAIVAPPVGGAFGSGAHEGAIDQRSPPVLHPAGPGVDQVIRVGGRRERKANWALSYQSICRSRAAARSRRPPPRRGRRSRSRSQPQQAIGGPVGLQDGSGTASITARPKGVSSSRPLGQRQLGFAAPGRPPRQPAAMTPGSVGAWGGPARSRGAKLHVGLHGPGVVASGKQRLAALAIVDPWLLPKSEPICPAQTPRAQISRQRTAPRIQGLMAALPTTRQPL